MIERPDIFIPLNKIGSASPECESAFAEWTAATKRVDDARAALQKAYEKTPEFAALRRLTGHKPVPINEDGLRISGKASSHEGGLAWDYKRVSQAPSMIQTPDGFFVHPEVMAGLHKVFDANKSLFKACP